MRNAALLVLALMAARAYGAPPEAVHNNNLAIDQLAKENSLGAYNSLLKALEIDPLNPTIQYNLGVVFLVNEEFEKAVKQFELADQLSRDDELKFKARFSAGFSASQLGNIPKALEAYQKALEIDPQSEKVKTNIELLWQSQQGKGQGEGQQNKKDPQDGEGDQNEDKDQNGDQDKKDQPRGQGPQEDKQKQKPKPQNFQSKELTQDQVRKILEELKAQEQKIRAQEYEKESKDAPQGKDW